jgi:ribonuclease HI
MKYKPAPVGQIPLMAEPATPAASNDKPTNGKPAKDVIIYTDGACRGNPGPGGWGAVLIYTTPNGQSIEKELSGFEPQTTNNRMELMAPIKALESLKEKVSTKLHSDSSYVVNAFNDGWLYNWRRNGWRKADKKPVENQDLWKRLLALTEFHYVTFVKVKGHSNDILNNRCDFLATNEIKKHLDI